MAIQHGEGGTKFERQVMLDELMKACCDNMCQKLLIPGELQKKRPFRREGAGMRRGLVGKMDGSKK